MRIRFSTSLLDEADPFEIDEGNLAHLAKHTPLTAEIAYAIWNAPDRVIADAPLDAGFADWIFLASISGVVVALYVAPSNSGEVTQCRPIGLYLASHRLTAYYQEHRP